MKKFLFLSAALALPLSARAQSNDSMSSGTAAPATMSAGSATDTAPAGASVSGSNTLGNLSIQDAHFIKTAAIAGMAEVNDGQLAESKGSAAVKAIGTQMVTDHAKANDQLKMIASQKGAMVPTMVDAKHMAVSAHLKMLSGAGFDKKYLGTELTGHEMTIAAFKAEASTGSDAALKSFASTTLPTLEQHLSMIKAAMK